MLRLLGEFSLERDARPYELAYEKGRALLAYLAIESGRVHARTSLAALFWPNLHRQAALTNLRQVLRDLRLALRVDDAPASASPLLIEHLSVRLDTGGALKTDAQAFARFAPACTTSCVPERCTPCLEQMEKLLAGYRGEFMAGCALPECPEFEEWLQIQREAMHLHALARLARLADCHEQRGNMAASLPFARRFLELEAWSEEGLQRLMRLLALNGQREAALAQYEKTCRLLKDELGILPADASRTLAERIRRGELSPPHSDTRPPSTLPVFPPAIAERRQITVLHCELACPALDDGDDPDEALTRLRQPQARCSEIIRNHAGHLVQVRGGSLLAYFGYPQASENAARQAVRAALAITRSPFAGVELRAGIHTGMIICGDDPAVPDAIGATSGLAIRLRQLANAGEVCLSAATWRLVAGYFAGASQGIHHLPGLARPLEIFRVENESGARDRIEAASSLTPLVGRQQEIATLRRLWEEARHGARCMLHIQGEAGIGKSRLVLALRESLNETAMVTHELRCFPEHSQSPFHPLVALFNSTLASVGSDSPAARFDTLAAYVETHYAATDAETVPLLAKLLSLPLRPPYGEPQSSPTQQRDKILHILLERIDALASQQALLLIVEDLHWVDPSTLEFLHLFIARQRTLPIFAVFTSRPEFKAPWKDSEMQTLRLKALENKETARLITAIAPDADEHTCRCIIERADGIPLFAEELAREITLGRPSVIPSTLQDLLASRLDSLGIAKRVAQAAATIGREFSLALLQHTTSLDDVALTQALDQLQNAGLLDATSGSTIRFRHTLMRDAAYQSQTRDEREAAHRRIALTLQAADAEVAPRPELLAQHWAAAGESEQAIRNWIAAGKLACQHSASHEAILHFQSGLALINKLPTDSSRPFLELELQIGLGAAACAIEGYASARGAAAYARAAALCSHRESNAEVFTAAWGLWASASSRSGYVEAQTLARQLIDIADHGKDVVQTQQAHFAVGDTLYWQGEFATARQHLEQIAPLYHPQQHAAHVSGFGEDAGVTSGAYLSWVLWFLGLPEQALAASARSLSLARQLGHPFSLAYALTFATILHCRLRQPVTALRLAEETRSLSSQYDFPLWAIGATLGRGWALAMQGQGEGCALLQQCINATRAAMGGVTLIVLEPLLDAQVLLGDFDGALATQAEALALGENIGDHHIEAELHRLQGEALLGQSRANTATAESCFLKALAISRQQQARSLELRAALSLARLWNRQEQHQQAHALLAEVYARFSEGSATADLLDARQFLDEAATRTSLP